MRYRWLPERGYDFIYISKKEFGFMPGSQQPSSMGDSIQVQDKRGYPQLSRENILDKVILDISCI